MNDTVTLYRPTGPEELALVEESGLQNGHQDYQNSRCSIR